MSNAGPKLMMAAAGAGGADLVEVANSALFDSANSETLSRTFTASDRDTWTFSCWVNLSKLSATEKYLLGAGADGNNLSEFGFDASYQLQYQHLDGGAVTDRVATTQVFRDTSGWYHLVCAVDTTNVTEANRVRIYVDGVEVSAFGTANYPVQNVDTDVNSAVEHFIGKRVASSLYYDGYMAETVFIDGTQYAATSFGEFSTDGLYWTPKSSDDIKALTFGQNGYYLSNEDGVAELDYSKASSTAATISYTAQASLDTNKTDYSGSFDGIAIGTAGATRQVVVSIDGPRATAGARTVSSCTIATISASLISRKTSSNGDAHEVWAADVPSGTTGDIDIVFNSGMDACAIGVWAVYNAASVYIDESTSGTTLSSSINIPTNAVAIATGRATTNTTATWAGVTENFDANFNTGNGATSGGSTSTSGTPTTISCTWASTGSDNTMIAVVFLPADGPLNHFTNNNTVVTSTHTPTNSYGFWNPIDRHDSVTLSNGNRTETHSTGDRPVFTETLPPNTKGYVEITADAFVSGDWIGVCNSDFVQGVDIAVSSNVWGYKPSTGYKSNGNGDPGVTYGGALAAGEIIGIAWDLTLGDGSNKIWIRNDGTWENSGDPAAGTGEMYATLPDHVRIVQGSRSSSTGTFTINPGVEAFGSAAPTGFMDGWSTTTVAEATTRTVSDPYDHWNNILYTGDGTAIGSGGQAVTGAGFTPDFAWIKRRSAVAVEHALTDIVRGVTKELSSNDTGIEETVAEGLTAFGSDGFTVGSDGSYNLSSDTYVAWLAKLGGAAATNSTGTISAEVSVNTTLGMSIGTFTGTGTAATIGHGLGVAPGMVMVKKRTDDATSWYVYHSGNTTAPETDYLLLDTTAATADLNTIWNDVAPTTTVFTIGTHTGVNDTGGTDTYMFMAFAPSQFISIGSYEGNANADGTYVPCLNSAGVPLMPIWTLIKNIDFADSWQVLDGARDTYNLTDTILLPNSTAAETTAGGRKLDFISGGIKHRGTDTAMNSAHTFINLTIGIPTIDKNGRLLTAR